MNCFIEDGIGTFLVYYFTTRGTAILVFCSTFATATTTTGFISGIAHLLICLFNFEVELRLNDFLGLLALGGLVKDVLISITLGDAGC